MSSEDQAMRLYDEHAPRLYAIALRITGDRDVAAVVLEEVFVDVANGAADDFASLARSTRERSLARQIRSASPPVDRAEPPKPRVLVEKVFYDGMTVSNLATAYSLSEELVRTMLRDGMAELRAQFAESGTQ